jgi:HAMP domain-containing protein
VPAVRRMSLRLHVVLLVAAGVAPALTGAGLLLARFDGGPIDIVVAAIAALFLVALFLVGIGIAYRIGSRVAAAIESIGDAALSLATGSPSQPIEPVVREVANALRALDTAAMRIRTRSQEVDKAVGDLRESEKRLLDFASASSDWFWEMDRDLETVNVIGRGGERYSADEMAQRSFHWPSRAQDEAAKQTLAADLRARRPFSRLHHGVRRRRQTALHQDQRRAL